MCLNNIQNSPSTSPSLKRFTPVLDLQQYVNTKNVIYVDVDREIFYTNPVEGLKKFVEIVYESAVPLIFDLENKKILCRSVVTIPNTNKALMVNNNVTVEIIEVRGRKMFPLVGIGHIVNEDSKLCYVVTKKFEVRVIKSPCKGIIFYIGEVFSRNEKILFIVIVGEENVIELTRAS